MGRVGEAYGVCPGLELEPFGQTEQTSEAEVHVEVARAAERVAVRISIMGIGITGDHRRSERRRVEEVTAEVCRRTSLPRAQWLATNLVILADKISRLD